MAEGSGTRQRAGGRPAVIALVLVIELVAVLFYLVDILSEVADGSFTAHHWWEGLVTIALLLGVALGAMELRRAMAHQEMQNKALMTASGEMDRVIREQFASWGLTPAERDVGYLALKGLDVAEIAAIRQAATGTVRAQLSGVYAKAGVTGRAQFAAHFVEDLLSGGLAPATVVPQAEEAAPDDDPRA